jgi:hypothetical protein
MNFKVISLLLLIFMFLFTWGCQMETGQHVMSNIETLKAAKASPGIEISPDMNPEDMEFENFAGNQALKIGINQSLVFKAQVSGYSISTLYWTVTSSCGTMNPLQSTIDSSGESQSTLTTANLTEKQIGIVVAYSSVDGSIVRSPYYYISVDPDYNSPPQPAIHIEGPGSIKAGTSEIYQAIVENVPSGGIYTWALKGDNNQDIGSIEFISPTDDSQVKITVIETDVELTGTIAVIYQYTENGQNKQILTTKLIQVIPTIEATLEITFPQGLEWEQGPYDSVPYLVLPLDSLIDFNYELTGYTADDVYRVYWYVTSNIGTIDSTSGVLTTKVSVNNITSGTLRLYVFLKNGEYLNAQIRVRLKP